MRVGDDELWRLRERFQRARKLSLARDKRNRVRVENVAQCLLLRQNQPSLRSRGVYRSDEDYNVVRLDEVGTDTLVISLALRERSNKLAEFLDILAVLRADRNFVFLKLVFLEFGQVGFVVRYDIRNVLLFKRAYQLTVAVAQSECAVGYQNGYIGLIDCVERALDTLTPQLADIVDTRRVDDHDRTGRQYFHSFSDRVGSCAGGVRNERQLL